MKALHILGGAVVVALFLFAPARALAHGFGERYDLPVPLDLYVAGAGATVLFSFVVIALFVSGKGGASYPRLSLLRWRAGRSVAHPWVLEAAKALSVAVFLVYLAAGLFGTGDPNRNLAPTLTWIIFWVGLAYFSAFVGNIWALINPWKILFGWAESAYRRATGGRPLARHRPYPSALGAWPAVGLFLAFAWVENVYLRSAVPFDLAVLAIAYSAVTFAGMFWYGRDAWLRNGEAFSLAFGYLARFAPTEVRVKGGSAQAGRQGRVLTAAGRVRDGQVEVTVERRSQDDPRVDDYEAYAAASPEDREWNVRPWGAGLLHLRPLSASHTVFLVAMLATVTFDGFAETSLWVRIQMAGVDVLWSTFGGDAFTVVRTLGLAMFPLLFLAVFAATARVMGRLGRSELGTLDIMRAFVLSLVPIALAYHVAHFFGFLLIQGQRIIPLASDPLGQGWNLFGTTGYTIDIAIVNVQAAWFVNVAAIVIGHIVAVYVAHVYATKLFPDRRLATLSQFPMMALMVGYTMVSLWIVAQPIVSMA